MIKVVYVDVILNQIKYEFIIKICRNNVIIYCIKKSNTIFNVFFFFRFDLKYPQTSYSLIQIKKYSL